MDQQYERSTPSGTRPLKIARSEALSYRDASVSDRPDHALRASAAAAVETDPETSERMRVRTRGSSACQTCRARKTKCDNRRPQCSYCARVQADCSYVEDGQPPHACDILGPKILDAITHLTNIVKHHQNGILAPSPGASTDNYSSPFGQIIDARPENYYDYASHLRAVSSSSAAAEIERSVPLPPSVKADKRIIAPQGLEQILKWNIFPPGTSDCASCQEPIFRSNGAAVPSQTSRLPDIDYQTLARLKARYISGVHLKNPFLDITHLEDLILQVVESGFDWSVNTCLVALVCSIGALTESFASIFPQRHASSTRGAHDLEQDADMQLAMQFWSVAVKRLGLVIGETTLEAVQCFCLAGIWHMHMLQPLQAWKCYGVAGNTYLILPKRESSADSVHKLRLEQAVWFTVYKSECELRLELPIPASILVDIDTQHTFPLPPQFERHFPSDDPLDTERAWYYYLAEIAARHLFNHLLHTRSTTPVTCTAKSISTLISQLAIFETQLSEWYTSLPAPIKFELPSGDEEDLVPLEDELRHILRGRYLSLRELFYRPFIQLCVEHDMYDALGREMVEQVAALASRGLVYEVYKLQAMVTKRHQGTWNVLRGQLSYAFVLLAVRRAARRGYTDRRAAAGVVMPAGWREAIRVTLARSAAFWEEGDGVSGPARQLRRELDLDGESVR